MHLNEFLNIFFRYLDSNFINYCVLRNYDRFPYENVGNDIDILVRQEDVKKIIIFLRSIDEVTPTDLIERPYVFSIFLDGVCWGVGNKAIQVDLITKLSWKGMPYLSVNNVLSKVLVKNNSSCAIKIPIIEHEALISFFSSYLVGGWIKEDYHDFVVTAFRNKKAEIIDLLRPNFGAKISNSLVGAVCSSDKIRTMMLLSSVRFSFIKKSITKQPLFITGQIIEHYLSEIIIRYTPYSIKSICVLGPDGVGKTTVIDALTVSLKNTVKNIHCRHLKPNIFRKNNPNDRIIDPHAKAKRSAFSSTIKIIIWFFELWLVEFFHGYKNTTLRIWDRYYHDILIDPKRYRYGGSSMIAKFVGNIVPKPDLFIVLDAPVKVVQSRKQEVSPDESQRQREAYLVFACGREDCIVVDTSQEFENTLCQVRAAVLDCMTNRFNARIGKLDG